MSKNKPRQLMTLDAETDPFKAGRIPKPFAWNLYDGSAHFTFWGDDCTEQLISHIVKHCDNGLIYAHNGGKFDVHFLLKYLNEDIKIINGRIAVCSIGTNEIRDSMLIFPQALSAYEKDEIDYSLFEADERENAKEKIIDYLRGDCRYLHEIVSAFRERFGDKLTAAGTAYAELKKSGYKTVTTNEFYDSQFRPFYFGGRVQPFKLGRIDGPLKYYDINSAYPFAMLHAHPSTGKINQHLKLPDKAGGWFAEILAISNGALPLRETEPIPRLKFHNDNKPRVYKATGWEIIAGLETGTLKILKVKNVIKHSGYCSMSDYVLKHYRERKEHKKSGDKLQEMFSKLLLNSAYGKFAQDSRQHKNWKLGQIGDDFEGFEWHSDINGMSMFSQPAENGRFNNCATGASITGFVRAYLWRAICDAVDPIYCDTDSLVCRNFKGQTGPELGQWKLEADIRTAYVGGRKNYAMLSVDGDWKQATKGFRVDCKEHAESIENSQKIVWKNDAPSFSVKYGARFIEREINHEKSL